MLSRARAAAARSDPAYRAGLLKAVEEALKVARKDNVSSGVLDGARLLEKALKSVGR